LVVDCIVCYGNLQRKAGRMAAGIRVKYLSDVLLAALEHDEKVLSYLCRSVQLMAKLLICIKDFLNEERVSIKEARRRALLTCSQSKANS